MKCHACNEEINPTMVYCMACGVPIETDLASVVMDEEIRARERRQAQSIEDAKHFFFLAAALLASVLALRYVLLVEVAADWRPSFTLPMNYVEPRVKVQEADLELLEVEIPLPDSK